MATIAVVQPIRQATTADHLFTLALCAAYRSARAKYPQTERMVKGFTIANAGKVELLDGGSARVASQFGTCTYEVNGACPCPDARHHAGDVCKHRWARALAKKAHALLAEAASASLNTPGAVCPDCGQATVIETALWGKHAQHYTPVRMCLMVVAIGEERYACGWREILA